MKNLLLNLLIIAAFCIGIYAQGGSVASKGGDFIQDTENGYSFTAPKDWKNQKVNDNHIFTNKAETANIVVKPHNYKDFATFAVAEVNLESEGYKQAGEVIDLGKGGKAVRVFKPVNGKYLIIDTFFLVSTYNGGVIVLSITNDVNTAKDILPIASELVKSVQYSRPQQSPQSSNYQSAFAGKKLSFFSTGNGYSENRTMWLCPSGAYFSKNEFLNSSTIGSGSTYSEDQGIWRIQANGGSVRLTLTSNKGKSLRDFTVTARQASNEVGLNGARYFVETHNQCK